MGLSNRPDLDRHKHLGRMSFCLRLIIGVYILVQVMTGSAVLAAEENNKKTKPQKANAKTNAAVKSESEVLTLDQALKLAAFENKDLKKAIEYKNYVEGRYIQERGAALPQLSFLSSYGDSRDETQRIIMPVYPLNREAYGGQVNLKQVVFTWGQVGAALKAAKIGKDAAEEQVRRYRQSVARDVAAAFYDLLLTQELAKIARENLEQKTRHLENARGRFKAGTATDYDVLAAEVAVENARPDLTRADNNVLLAKERLALLIGRLGKAFEVSGSLEAEIKPLPKVEEAKAEALEKRPEMTESKLRLDIQRELIKVYKAGDKPRIDIQANYGWQHLKMDEYKGQGWAGSAGIYLTWPFFDGLKTQGQVMQARSELESLNLDEGKLKDSISLQVFDALNILKESSDIVKGLTGTVTQAQRLAEMAEKGYSLGVKTNLDVQDAQLNLIQSKGGLAKAKRDYLVAKVTFQWVLGALDLPKDDFIPGNSEKRNN